MPMNPDHLSFLSQATTLSPPSMYTKNKMLQSFQKRREKDKIKRQGDKLQNNPTPNGPPCFRGAFPQPSRDLPHARRNQPTPPPPVTTATSLRLASLLESLQPPRIPSPPQLPAPSCRPPAAACTVLPVSAPFVFRAPADSASAVSRCWLSWQHQCRKILTWICARLLSWVSWPVRFLRQLLASWFCGLGPAVEFGFVSRVNVGCAPSPHLERVRPWNYFRGFSSVAVPDVAFVAIVRLTCLY